MDASRDPVQWLPGVANAGTREVTEEAFLHTPEPGEIMGTYPHGAIYSDVSVRTQVRLLGDTVVLAVIAIVVLLSSARKGCAKALPDRRADAL